MYIGKIVGPRLHDQEKGYRPRPLAPLVVAFAHGPVFCTFPFYIPKLVLSPRSPALDLASVA